MDKLLKIHLSKLIHRKSVQERKIIGWLLMKIEAKIPKLSPVMYKNYILSHVGFVLEIQDCLRLENP